MNFHRPKTLSAVSGDQMMRAVIEESSGLACKAREAHPHVLRTSKMPRLQSDEKSLMASQPTLGCISEALSLNSACAFAILVTLARLRRSFKKQSTLQDSRKSRVYLQAYSRDRQDPVCLFRFMLVAACQDFAAKRNKRGTSSRSFC